jgi:cytochrome b561
VRFSNSDQRYGIVTKLLHWSTALLIVGLIALGWYMVDLSYYDKWYHDSLETHKALGIIVFMVGVMTLIWQRVSPSPAHVASLARWERIAATAMHHTLLLLVLLIPVTGYVISISAGKSIEVFGLFEIPALFNVSERLRDLAIECHFYLAYGTGVLVLLHAAAALKHQFIDRDGTLARMLWR